ncbi:AlpA family phage regulatory protein [Qipengyuania sp. 1NDH17]|uniref:AlpA family phage regulatory protein n=1 Tax=Qipengyuania polymorpha TaxID=2867234 RepID=A0ABS7J5B3_9SPHN|nr:AlpA family phage regulatory protein [Qipengyuania polymorpha]MBX7459264.1 AlpA family phage regulatory protein [Qipengyuania polymorpha]
MARLLSPKKVCEEVSFSRATLDRLVAAGDFPAPIRITQNRLAYSAEAVEKWIADKLGAA